jgi:hypothetical protein
LSGLKKCPKCEKNIPISDFYEDVTKDDNSSVYCKACVKKYFKQFKKPRGKR